MPADLSGREPPLREMVKQLRSEMSDAASEFDRRSGYGGMAWRVLMRLDQILAADAARAPVGLEGLMWAIKEEMIEGWRDSTTPTTFGVVSSLIEALVNSCVPVQDPADRAWDAATNVVDTRRADYIQRLRASTKVMTDRLEQSERVGPLPPEAPVAETPPADLVRLVLDLQAHASECGWQDTDEPIAALLQWTPAEPGRARETAPAPDWHPFDTAPKDRWVWMCNLDRQRISAFKWDSSHKAWFAGTGWWPSISKFFTHWSEMSEQPPSVPAAAPPAQEPTP